MKKSTTLVLLLFGLVFFAAGQTGPFSLSANSNKANQPDSFGLPFYEDWSSGSFETNNWTTDCDYWAIDGMEGNEKPSAKFNGSPLVQEQYTCSLVSDTFNGDLFKVGQIMLEFDISLNNRINTATEKLLVEVRDSTGWNTVAEFTNDGSFDWSAHSVDIADYALGHTFQIRFKATGPNSFNVKSWHIDNISLYRMCEAPENLVVEYYWWHFDDFGAMVFWTPPESTITEIFNWMYWDSNEHVGGLGLTSEGDFSVAVQWDSLQLEEYFGDTIDAIRFYLNDTGYSEVIVKIWTGEDAENLIYSDTVLNPVSDAWNEHILDTLILIDLVENYRVGYTILGQPAGYFPAGLDYGPAIPGYGDLLYFEPDGWINLSDVGIDKNLNIQMKLLNSNTPDTTNCIGFNVYRQQPGIDPDYYFYNYTSFITNKTWYEFNDQNIGNPEQNTYCYKVEAVWANSGDTCISSFAKTVPQTEDYACAMVMDIRNITEENPLSIYPNPATNTLNITAKDGQAIQEVSIYNLTGQLVFRGEMKNNSIDISQLQSGMYVVEVDLGQRKIREKLLVK
ncbi:MAG: T9SS type A sorting domain-containing protein [Bacteroidales bacterium]|nr:T9SS type A sorting domain-containing protein [Bacteroidales bacterium]